MSNPVDTARAPAPATHQAAAHGAGGRPLDVARLREDFPILKRLVHGRRLVYLDNAATSQKPQCMIDALTAFYANYNANVHRGIHTLAEEATANYEATRKKTARLIGDTDPQRIVFTRNSTESLNLLAHALERRLEPGDEILLTQMEHHSNLVPWFMLAERARLRVRHIPVDPAEGRLDLSRLNELITPRTKIVSIVHISNVLATINPVEEIFDMARKAGAVTILDAAQSVPHLPVDVTRLGADFVVFSAHKMLGPTGVGVLWAAADGLERLDPFLGGGEMISEVELDRATWNTPPWKFEAGTPNIAGVIAFGAAIDYLQRTGLANIHRHEQRLMEYALDKMLSLNWVTIYGPKAPEDRSGLITFTVKDIHPHDLSTILDHCGVAIRAGHHCAQPLHSLMGVSSTARASFYLYNDFGDIDALIDSLKEARKYFGLN
ncbi:MAG: cysteine desulfurase [Candidatus Sumerlaeia bacterium]